jgi:virulence factor Mce-like protein
MRRGTVTAVVLAAILAVALPACSFGGHRSAVYRADFTRAVQVFPGIKVRVLGVSVGHVIDVTNVPGAVRVTFSVDDGTRLPQDVNGAVIPMSLLGERYIQLFPAYTGGRALTPGATIPVSRTAVPAEPDELLRSLQDYMGALDPQTVSEFVQNADAILQGNGAALNTLIEHGASVLATLSSKRDDLSQLIVELDRLTVALSTRQAALGRLIRNYDAVAGVLTKNRQALEGTVTGLNDAATQLASLLIAHRAPLERDVEAVTRTGRTLERNTGQIVDTTLWAQRLFRAASRAVDYNRNWLRLNDQGAELAALILLRLEQRLMDLCAGLGVESCAGSNFWSSRVPDLFCFLKVCPAGSALPGQQLSQALASVPQIAQMLQMQTQRDGGSLDGLVGRLLDSTVGDPSIGEWSSP